MGVSTAGLAGGDCPGRWSPNSLAWRGSGSSTACRARVTLPVAAAALLAVVATGSYRPR